MDLTSAVGVDESADHRATEWQATTAAERRHGADRVQGGPGPRR
ncbi:hypothetical protein [Yinghuangia soli]|nr:hypothetical protein [Yinghuangia soli]